MNTLLIVDDERAVRYSFKRMFEDDYRVITAESGNDALETLDSGDTNIDVIFLDVRMPGMNGIETLKEIKERMRNMPVIMMTAFSDSAIAIEAMKEGAFDYLLKPFDNNQLKEVVEKAVTSARLQLRTTCCDITDTASYEAETIVGKSRAILDVCKMIGEVAVTDVSVLISGESGVGKEIVARAIYNYSKRKEKPFMAVNCAALPEGVVESELFGCEKGAFTGAEKRRIGRFEQCDGGTIFLDEIGDMSLSTQAKLLRILQDGTFERVGSNETIMADVRVIAASNKSLPDEVMNGRFREDLFHRLNVFSIHIRPLRERKEDIPLLSEYFILRVGKETDKQIKGISREAIELLMSYNWPGNVRELENVIKRAVVVAKSDIIGAADISINMSAEPHKEELQELSMAINFIWDRAMAKEITVDIFHSVISGAEKILIEKALGAAKGNKAHAASMLGITRVTLRKKMQEYNILSE
ncbi:MAG TPA: sigma-54-dependent Fis family transcriptional regulator [Nitrospirae bacterium]|nr:transcriptional regulatory protein ZraR [bacterium BMS3Abin06]HDH11628.1 sigma-54-dependent Fis family transcriptional regulator [Nitrospirota bacterium]HDZ02048.1 sigma-54-dependent Fis family transcriptional regulator [Nitrospirota bacterium]